MDVLPRRKHVIYVQAVIPNLFFFFGKRFDLQTWEFFLESETTFMLKTFFGLYVGRWRL